MSEWKTCSVEEISEKVCVGFVGTCAKYYCDEGPDSVPMIRTTDLREDGLATGALLYISKEFHEANKKSQLVYGDILVARHGDNGKAVMYKLKEAANCLNVIIIRPDHELVDHFFLLYLLNNPSTRAEIKSMSSGSVQDVINTKQIANLPILLPPLPEQRAIASVLSSLDDKIDLLYRQNKTLETMAETLFRQWFVEEADEGWEEVTLGDFFPVVTGKRDANFGTDDGLYPFFTCSQNPIKAPEYSFDGSAILLAGNGDFNIKRYVGKFEAYQRTYVLIPSDITYFNFLYTLMKFYLSEITGGHQGSVINFITKGMITSFKFNLPRDRSCITNKLFQFNQIFEKIDNNSKKIRTLEKLRDTLLPKLMAGEVRVDYKKEAAGEY